MSKEYQNLQLVIDKEVVELLREQKKIQRKSMALIVEELLIEKYATLNYKLKNME